jgi:hypothetical protein
MDINNDTEIAQSNSSTFMYTFENEGKYNVLLIVRKAS